MYKVKKRDGTLVPFEIAKIENVIRKALKENGYLYDEVDEIAKTIADKVYIWDKISIEEIQDQIIELLRDYDYNDVADKYIQYRGYKEALRDKVQTYLDFIENYKQSDNTANATIDANANVSNHNIAVLNAEIHKPSNQDVNMRILRDEVKRLYPDFNYKQMDIDFNSIAYLHDANSQIIMPYCVSISLYPFLLNGIKDLGGLSAAPKNIESFCGMFVNMIFAIASQFKGAVATPGFILCMDYFIRKRYGNDYHNNLELDVLCNSIEHRTLRSQISQWFQQVTYSINQPSSARGAQSVFWNLSFFDKPFYEGMYGDFYFPDGTKPQWESFNFLQQYYLHWLNEERLKCMLTFPVCSYALIYKDGEFVDKKAADFVAQEYSEGNSFFTYLSDSVDSLSSCCRLQNKLSNNTFNFTNGQIGEQTGSLNVITLNMNRIVQDYKKQDKLNFHDYFVNILDRIYKYQIAYKNILMNIREAHLFPAYDANFINMSRQYLTIGVNGLNQAAEFLGIKCTNNDNYAEFCHQIFGTIKEQNMLHKAPGLMFNTEQTPCENAAIKLYNRDKKDGYWVPEDTNLYASYVYKPNDESISVLDKFVMHGDKFLGSYCDGGQAAHINLDSHLDKTQYELLLKHAGRVGCKYFTFNIPNCECDNCGFIAKQPFKQCPKCGSTSVSLWDRVIGYLVKIKNWSKGRQIEQKTRIYSKL